ncbi:LytR/AlgR family response regulator transcription factor [Tenacibaculum agarivorans]|uniref:LytR/AlgR family response regulator transcription factor n=1 Tax=Tenacibaculum agarivorans TaxID=1908389 RepID=UPI00094BB9DA|nr:response regulator transcription factor [Tenacibaculum agarivorans]
MKVYIIEDEIFQLEDIKISLENLNHICIGSNDTPIDALDEIGKLNPDIVLIDIHLQKREAGIQLAGKIKEFYNIPIIFITSEQDDTIIEKASTLAPIAYLTKPIKESDLKASLILAEKLINSNTTTIETIKEFFARSGNKLHKISLDTILYAHTDSKNYCTIVTLDEKKFSVRNSITGLLKTLNSNQFIQTHRSFLINWNFITSFSESDQSIDLKYHNLSIPVGRTYKSEILKRLQII